MKMDVRRYRQYLAMQNMVIIVWSLSYQCSAFGSVFSPGFQAKQQRTLSHIRYAAALIHQLIKTTNM